MNILIIGGTGLVGPYVIQEIFSNVKKARISTITRSGETVFCEKAFKCDRNDKQNAAKILDDVQPDLIIDMIPFTVEDATNTCQILNDFNPDIPVIMISSIDIYAAYAKLHGTEDIDYQTCPISEDMELRKILGVEGVVYDKLNVERIYFDAMKNVTVLRLPATYGWPDTRRIEKYLLPMLNGETVIELSKKQASWKFSRCLHKNVAFAVFKAVEANQRGHYIYNVAEELPFTEKEWCMKIAKIAGWAGQVKITENAEEKLDFNQNFFVSTDKIRKNLGFFEKYSIDEGLAEAVKQYAMNQYQKPYKQCY